MFKIKKKKFRAFCISNTHRAWNFRSANNSLFQRKKKSFFFSLLEFFHSFPPTPSPFLISSGNHLAGDRGKVFQHTSPSPTDSCTPRELFSTKNLCCNVLSLAPKDVCLQFSGALEGPVVKAVFTLANTSHPSGTLGGAQVGLWVSALCSRLSINGANLESLWCLRGVSRHDHLWAF